MSERPALDASALLAYLQREPGWERVESLLLDGRCSMCSVNLAEVLSRLADWGVPLDAAEASLGAFDLETVPFDVALARAVADLRPLTRDLGLSLGDRACLALAKVRGATAIAPDRAWTKVPPEASVKVESIRPDRG